jgi:hypothetical protein
MIRVPGSIPNIITGFCKEVVIFTAVLVNKNIKIVVNYFLGPVLFAFLCFSIYRQVQHQPRLSDSWQQIKTSAGSIKLIFLLLPLIMIFLNWGLEAWKWKLSISQVARISFWQSFKATLSGVTFSVSMPNRVGEYLGRVLYLPEGSRLKTISVTIVGSFAQLLVTLVAGLAGLIILKKHLQQSFPGIFIWYQFLLYGLILVVILMLLIYFNVSGVVKLFTRWIKNKKYYYLVEALNSFSNDLLLKILLISILRYLVFLMQYVLLFYFFGVNVPALVICWVMTVVFLALAVIPSISLVELGIRGEVSLRLMGIFSTNNLGISLTSVTIWFINLIVPAIIGSLFMLNLRVFKGKRKDNS